MGIVFSDPTVGHLIDSRRVDNDGWFEAECLADGCDWVTDGYETVVEDAAYEHVNRTHREDGA